MFDTEKFIGEIEARPALYNIKSKEYSNREVKANCWNEIGREMYKDWDSPEVSNRKRDERVKDLMKRWKTLRDCFVKDLKLMATPCAGKAPKKKYLYFDHLQFILPYIKSNLAAASNSGPQAPAPSDDVEDEQDAMFPYYDEPTSDGYGESDVRTSEQQTYPSKKRKIETPSVVAGKRAAMEKSVANIANELTNIIATNLQMQRDERYDKNGHKAFLMSYLPLLDSLPFAQAMLLRGQISDVFTNFITNHVNQVPRSNSSVLSAPQSPASETLVTEPEVFDRSGNVQL